MTTSSIIGLFFSIELAIVASGLAVYLFFQLKRIRQKFNALNADKDTEAEETPTLHDLFDMQITRTRKKITEQISTDNEDEQKKQHSLLSQRIEFLKIEKEVMEEHVTDQSYWEKLCERIAGVVTIDNSETSEAQIEPEIIDDSKYKRRIANYQTQLNNLHEEFEEYRKTSNKLATGLSNYNKDDEQDNALNELMADFKAHDERLITRLSQLQKENEKLGTNLNDAEREAYIREYKLKQSSQEGGPELTSNTASEEEIKNLREIISRQYGTLDELRAAVIGSQSESTDTQEVTKQLEAIERSQQELTSCIEVLEMENQRLTEELVDARAQSNQDRVEVGATPPEELYELRLQSKELNDEVTILNNQLSEKDKKIEELEGEYGTLQKEFMQMYDNQQK